MARSPSPSVSSSCTKSPAASRLRFQFADHDGFDGDGAACERCVGAVSWMADRGRVEAAAVVVRESTCDG
jgi:hypothetical protein